MRVLDALYRAGGVLAAIFLAIIAALTLAQIIGRLLGILVPAAAEFAGFAMAASSFLALAQTLRTGGHIRVSLLTARLSPGARRAVECWCLLLATAMIGFFAWFSVTLVWESYAFGDVSTGIVAIPLWIPQLGMAFGVVLLEIAFIEELIRVLRGLPPTYERAEEGGVAMSE